MGICLDAPVWGPSRVLGCCHRDGGEPLVVWGQTETPLFSWGVARHDPPRLAPFDLGGKQRAASLERNTSFQVHFADCGCRSSETDEKWKIWILVMDYRPTVSLYEGSFIFNESQMSTLLSSLKNQKCSYFKLSKTRLNFIISTQMRNEIKT